eukprot:scaffold83818_cov35-Tisochrysis_lutea.AAC.4
MTLALSIAATRRYEIYFHLICWPIPAMLTGMTFALGYLGDAGAPHAGDKPTSLREPVLNFTPLLPACIGPFCALGPAYAPQYLLSFHAPLLCAFFFNLVRPLFPCPARRARQNRRPQ